MQMKKFLIDFVFEHYRKDVEDRFISDIFGEVPNELTASQMKFLLSGGTAFNKWMRWSSYALQRKLSGTNKEVGFVAIGGLIFFKTLQTMLSRLEKGEELLPPDESTTTPPPPNLDESMRGVDEFFENKRSQ